MAGRTEARICRARAKTLAAVAAVSYFDPGVDKLEEASACTFFLSASPSAFALFVAVYYHVRRMDTAPADSKLANIKLILNSVGQAGMALV